MVQARPSHPALKISVLTILLLLPSLFFVTRQSIWIDEAWSCWFADHAKGLNPAQFPDLAAVPEMPAFHVLLIFWVSLFGDSERALRAINLPFAALFLASVGRLCYQAANRFWWAIAVPFAFFPMLSYYVNECRPYTALLGLSTAAGTCLYLHIKNGSRHTAWCCSLMCVFAFSMHLLGGLCVFVLCLWGIVSSENRRRLTKTWRIWSLPALTSIPGYLLLFAYYIHVGREGIPGSSRSLNIATPGNNASTWKNLVFFVYEALGFDGLGPPRNAIRVNPSIHNFSDYGIFILIGFLSLAALTGYICRSGKNVKSVVEGRNLLLCSCFGVCILFLAARVNHFGFFGRHGMVLIGLLCCSIVIALSAPEAPRVMKSLTIALLSFSWILSSFRILSIYPYGKYDARTALHVASETGLRVLWNGDEKEVEYYGGFDPIDVRHGLSGPQQRGRHWQATTPVTIFPQDTEAGVNRAIHSLARGSYVLVTGKEDIYDPTGIWHQALVRWHPVLLNRLNGFDVWRVTIP